jgi:hypothetical protein
MSPPARSIRSYAGIVAVLAILLAVIQALEIDATVPAVQRSQLTVPALLATALLGLAGVHLAERTGFPGIWDPRVSTTHKLLIPLSLGLAFGAGFRLLGLQQLILDPKQPPFPALIPYFLYGAGLSEILFRLFLMPLLVWLVSNLLLGGRAEEPASWGAAGLSSLIEPLSQVGAMLSLGIQSGPWIALVFAVVFSANLVQGRLFRAYGFGASLVMRLAFYMAWHIIPAMTISTSLLA